MVPGASSTSPCRSRPTSSYDVTPPAVAAEMTRQDATITKLAGVLQGTINPSVTGRDRAGAAAGGLAELSRPQLLFRAQPVAPGGWPSDDRLRGIGSAASATVYGENRTVPISSSTITDNFGPYAVHIYQVP